MKAELGVKDLTFRYLVLARDESNAGLAVPYFLCLVVIKLLRDSTFACSPLYKPCFCAIGNLMLSRSISAGTSYARAAAVDRQNAPLRQHRCVCHVQRAPLVGPSTIGAPRTDSLCGSGQLDKGEATEFGLLHTPSFVHQQHFMLFICCCFLSYIQVSSLVTAPPGVAAAKFPEHL